MKGSDKREKMGRFLAVFGYDGAMGMLCLLGVFYILAGPIYHAKRRETRVLRH